MTKLCGCFYYLADTSLYQPRSRSYLPLLNSVAHTTILSTSSTTALKQKFTNPSPSEVIKECIYNFPLYDGVSVVGFTCKIGAKALTGLVKEKTKAKKIFDEAVAQGETAGLLEQAQESSDVFSTKLGNIPAGESVIVEITYIGELKYHDTEGIRFTIPTSIAPRYGSVSGVTSSTIIHDDNGIEITVDVDMPDGSFINSVQSPSHPIAVSMGTVTTGTQADPVMNKASATLSLGSASLEKDFVLIVKSKDVGTPKALLETHPTIPNHRAIMTTLVPKFSLPPSRPEIVFLADRSGSMAGTNIAMLMSAMKVFLKSMPTGVKFNIGSFGTHCSFLWPKSQGYTSETLQESMAHVETFNASMGGTETFKAVEATINRRYTDLPLEIILLTDGDIWQQGVLFDYVNQQVASSEGQIRIFPLGIGNGVSHSLIEGLARAGNGFAQTVQSGERMENSVVRMLRGAVSPHITDYTLEVKYDEEDDDFELIEKVTDGMKVLLSETDLEKETKAESLPKATISLFDSNVNPENDDITMKDVEVVLPKIAIPKLLQAPHKIPSLFPFSRTTVYLLMSPETIQKNPSSVILRATSPHGPLAVEIPVESLSQPGKTIHQLAARKAVQDLEEGRGWIFDAKDQAGILVKDRFPSCFEDLIKQEAVRLGEKFQVVSKWCSFVAVTANGDEQPLTTLHQQPRHFQVPMIPGSLSRCSEGRSVSGSWGPRLTQQQMHVPPQGSRGGGTPRRPQFRSRGGGVSGQALSGGNILGFGSFRQPPLPSPSGLFGSAHNMHPQSAGGPSGGLASALQAKRKNISSPAAQESPQDVSRWTNKPSTEKVLALIELQEFEGSWPEGNQEVAAILGVYSLQPPLQGSEKAWTTLLVVLFLEMKNAAEEGTWGLVVEKARDWLMENIPTGLEDLEKAAVAIISTA